MESGISLVHYGYGMRGTTLRNRDMKSVIKTVLNNVIQLERTLSGPMMFTYTEEIISSKWTAELDPQPGSFVEVIETELGDSLNPGNGGSQCQITSDEPTDEEGVSGGNDTPTDSLSQ